jgi:hypothetical protein
MVEFIEERYDFFSNNRQKPKKWGKFQEALGIDSIIAHAADVPAGEKERIQKDNGVESRKPARSLRPFNSCNPVFISFSFVRIFRRGLKSLF